MNHEQVRSKLKTVGIPEFPKHEKETAEFKQGVFKMGRCNVIVSIDNDKWHLSISAEVQPSYKELKQARYRYLPDNIYAAQIFPPSSEFVNIHPNCHHLYEI